MSDAAFFPEPILIKDLRKDRPNFHMVDAETAVVVLVLPDKSFRVLRDICPHMGGPLSQGRYDATNATLQCRWHGYVFDVETCAFKENPNDEVYACMQHLYESFAPETRPRYKLPSLGYELRGDQLFVSRGLAK
jgi:nitrite reductase/ring-hydroxylating ferredoxin subunit